MKCHYDVLGVSQNASDEDIKRAYKKLALKWHPDKNLENTEEAKEQFLLVQQAFELLSDPHERAWYDKRRDEILRGHSKDGYVDNSLDLFQFFNPCAFRGYGDDEKGFYTVFRTVFVTIAKEEMEFCRDYSAPEFGKSDSSYDKIVQPFYSFWQSFVTKKSFSWLDPYDPKSAPNRAVMRMIEKENKKIRDKARKQRTEDVRALVAFVRKRDKRVQAQVEIMREKAKENQKKMEEHRLKRIKEQNKALKDYKELEWSKLSENELKSIEASVASEFGEDSAASSSDSDEETCIRTLYCSVCNKLFKSIKQFMNHEQSKKHKERADKFKVCEKTSVGGEKSNPVAPKGRKAEAKTQKFQLSDCSSYESGSFSEISDTDDELVQTIGKKPLLSKTEKSAGNRETITTQNQSKTAPVKLTSNVKKDKTMFKKCEGAVSHEKKIRSSESSFEKAQPSKHEKLSSSSESDILTSHGNTQSSQSISLSISKSEVVSTISNTTQASNISKEILCVDPPGKKILPENDCIYNIKCQSVPCEKEKDLACNNSSVPLKNNSINFKCTVMSASGLSENKKLPNETNRTEINLLNEGQISDTNLSESESDSSSSADRNLCKFCFSNNSYIESCNHCINELKKKKTEQKKLKTIKKCEEDITSDEILCCMANKMSSLSMYNVSSFNSHSHDVSNEETKKTSLKKKKKQKKTVKTNHENHEKPLSELMADLDSVGLSKKQRKKLEQQSRLMKFLDENDDGFCAPIKKDSKKKVTSKRINKFSLSGDSDAEKCSPENKDDNNLKTFASKSSVNFCNDKIESENMPEKINSGSDSNLHHCLECNASFKSKNKLFDHLRQTKHALPVAQEVRNVKKAGKNKSKRQC